MKLSGHLTPVDDLAAHAEEVVNAVSQDRRPMVITVGGEAKAVMQDIESFEESQKTLALLKILALTTKAVEAGDVSPVDEAFHRIRGTFDDRGPNS
ncbi:MAG: type II toxin-antitoxin system prevent-host-death family antitoxin [Deinococcus-Thermus bacterium]|jgi:prevent-host-death family protein|nr:type II toxin-antitoxin system prevent-host-death family antitoxin [Deinococcota bacterium]